MEDSKKKKAKKLSPGKTKSPGTNIVRAKAITTSKKSRGFSTKKPPAAYLSYPL